MAPCKKCGYDDEAMVVRSWTFIIDKELKSLNMMARNKIGFNRKANLDKKTRRMLHAQAAAYRKEREEWQMWMKVMKANHQVPDATGKRRVTIERLMGKGQRPYDRDNAAGGAKPCLDAMVHVRMLVNDAKENAELHYLQTKSLVERTGVRVTIEELAE